VTFQKHYTREEAQALLPQVCSWLERISELRRELEEHEKHIGALMAQGGEAGGDPVNCWLRAVAEFKHVLFEFQRRQIFIKDLQRGLVDFPALRGDKEVFLCWERGEAGIEYWHELDAGYAGREPL